MNSECASSSSRMAEVELWDWQPSETSGQIGKYIILSHRWNEAAEACKTTRSNYSHQFEDVRHESPGMGLSSLFLDVCRMAFRFHIQYVWIDSICIIQDDPDDWKRDVEAEDLPQNLNRGAGMLTGFPFARVSRLPYPNIGGLQEGYFYVQSCDTDLREAYKSGVTNSELLDRGWVHQEWTLSRRILTFSRMDVFLECQSSDPQSVFGDMDWEKTIQRFSVLRLTKLAQDRLVAIAGIAKEFSCAIDSWRDRTPKARDNNVCTISHAQSTRVDGIPTWSWASIGGSEITYPYRRYRDAEMCDIFKAVTIPVEGSTWLPDFTRPMLNTIPNDEFGNDNRFVVLGILAVMQPVRVEQVFTSIDDAYTAKTANTCYSREPKETWRRVSTTSNPNLIAGWAALDTAACQSSLGAIHALYIGKINRYQEGWYQYVFEVLYLRPVVRQGFPGCFERIGVGRLFGPDVERFFDTTEKTPIYLV
ncbi:hypothetical protein F5Y09DRAFT_345061 [Xylaria sp. FL1042]|nr:hypothetical protein F5Y09DRAFT_345061 [Xylaria sp. FL1042]